MTPKDAALHFIRPYVERGDSYESLVEGGMAYYGADYAASIGFGYTHCPAKNAHELVVMRLGSEWCCHRFSLRKLFNEIKSGATQGKLL